MKSRVYSEVFEPEFLQQFAHPDEIGSMILNGDRIEVDRVAETDGYDVEYKNNIETSGLYDDDEHKIIVNGEEPEYRQRFTLAHELGHAVNNHPGKQYRATLMSDKSDLSERINDGFEIVANKFAANLLMPERLVVSVMKNIMIEDDINPKRFDSTEYDHMVEQASRRLDVSESAFKFRVKNLHLIKQSQLDE